MSLTGIDFVLQYGSMLDHLKQIMSSEYHELIFRYRFIDPHDLVGPEDEFDSNEEMIQHLSILISIDHLEGDPMNRN